MGYKMYEITSEKKTELMEHAEKAYEHIGKMLDCIEGMGGQMGQREGDEWYIRQGGMPRAYGMRDEMGYRDEMGMGEDMMGERRGVRGTGRYGMRMGYREPNPYYRNY